MTDWYASGGYTAHALTICPWVDKWHWSSLILLLDFWEARKYSNLSGPWYKYGGMWLGKCVAVASLGEEVTIEKHEQSGHCLFYSTLCEERKTGLRFLNILLVDFLTCHDHNVVPRKSAFISRNYFLPSPEFWLRTLVFDTVLRLAGGVFCTSVIIVKELKSFLASWHTGCKYFFCTEVEEKLK